MFDNRPYLNLSNNGNSGGIYPAFYSSRYDYNVDGGSPRMAVYYVESSSEQRTEARFVSAYSERNKNIGYVESNRPLITYGNEGRTAREDSGNYESHNGYWLNLGIFELTAYCPCILCTEIWSAEHPRNGSDFVQRTASGTIPSAGRTIAVDTSVIPFGTVVKINGREYVAEDRGGLIRGNIIDIFHDCHQEALEFGRQKAEVYIRTELTE